MSRLLLKLTLHIRLQNRQKVTKLTIKTLKVFENLLELKQHYHFSFLIFLYICKNLICFLWKIS